MSCYSLQAAFLYSQVGDEQQVELRLRGEECSDFLNFVVKDSSTGTWYDFYKDNFHVPLRLALSTLALESIDDEEVNSVAEAQLPELPGELTGIWAYIKWENDGCPNRSQQESDAEFRRGIQVTCCACLSWSIYLSYLFISCTSCFPHIIHLSAAWIAIFFEVK